MEHRRKPVRRIRCARPVLASTASGPSGGGDRHGWLSCFGGVPLSAQTVKVCRRIRGYAGSGDYYAAKKLGVCRVFAGIAGYCRVAGQAIFFGDLRFWKRIQARSIDRGYGAGPYRLGPLGRRDKPHENEVRDEARTPKESMQVVDFPHLQRVVLASRREGDDWCTHQELNLKPSDP